ncbi:MAG: riboflavin synthase [Phycisphaerales bacterium]|nr:riboflavin synthase [Phycisphaerales bacterium]
MFTGLIQGVGTVSARDTRGAGVRLAVDLGPLAPRACAGDSVSVHGVCLTVAGEDHAIRAFDLVEETLCRTTLGSLGRGSRVNLELALRAGDGIGGHIVQGHVDSVGRVTRVDLAQGRHRVRVELPLEISSMMVAQGSVTIDGVSLTIASCSDAWIEVALIPETLGRTTLPDLAEGALVNIEVDALARLVDAAVRRRMRV